MQISNDDILDCFDGGNSLLLSKDKRFFDLNIGCQVMIGEEKFSVTNIQFGKNRLLLQIKKHSHKYIPS